VRFRNWFVRIWAQPCKLLHPAHATWPSLLLFCVAISSWALPAAAIESPRAAGPLASGTEHPHEVGIGFTAGAGDIGVGALQLGIDAWYRPIKSAAFGVEALGFFVDNGADPQYCYGCLRGGTLLTGFAEARLGADRVLSGFARVGVGAAQLRFIAKDLSLRDEERTNMVLLLALGPQLTLWHFFLRARGIGTFTSDTFFGYGLELGGVF
jgi:hypothetical protein